MFPRLLALTLVFSVFSPHGIQAKLAAVAQDEFCSPASAELAEVAEKAANLMDFSQEYLLFVCKQRAIQANPSTKFLSLGMHPTVKKHFIMLNKDWFSGLNEEEQLFLFARCFAFFEKGLTPLSVKALACVPFAIQAMVIPVYYALDKTLLADSNVLIKMLASQAIVMLANGLTNVPYCWLFNKTQLSHEIMVNELVIERTGNKLAARRALEYMDSSINQEIAAGDSHWLALQTRFAQLAQAIQV